MWKEGLEDWTLTGHMEGKSDRKKAAHNLHNEHVYMFGKNSDYVA